MFLSKNHVYIVLCGALIDISISVMHMLWPSVLFFLIVFVHAQVKAHLGRVSSAPWMWPLESWSWFVSGVCLHSKVEPRVHLSVMTINNWIRIEDPWNRFIIGPRHAKRARTTWHVISSNLHLKFETRWRKPYSTHIQGAIFTVSIVISRLLSLPSCYLRNKVGKKA